MRHVAAQLQIAFQALACSRRIHMIPFPMWQQGDPRVAPKQLQRLVRRGVVHAECLTRAASLLFSTKDELQAQWVLRQCRRHVELPSHTLPSSQAFLTVALAGMGWGLQPWSLVKDLLATGALMELVPGTPQNVPLYWQHARAGSGLLTDLTCAVQAAASATLRPR